MYPRISQGRRVLGITIDWLAAYAITLGFFAGGGGFLERSRGIGGTVLHGDGSAISHPGQPRWILIWPSPRSDSRWFALAMVER